MTRKPKSTPSPAPRRNPHARVLGTGLFRERVVKGQKGYVRKPKHPKPVKIDEAEP